MPKRTKKQVKGINQRHIRKIAATAIIIILGLFLLYAAIPYSKGLIWAVVLFIIFNPVYRAIQHRFKRKAPSAILTIILILLIVVIPVIALGSVLIGEVSNVVAELPTYGTATENFLSQYGVNVEISNYFKEFGSTIKNYVQASGSSILDTFFSVVVHITDFTINLIIFLFVIFYLFVNSHGLKEHLTPYIPFNNKNSLRLLKEFENITFATIIGMGVIAIIQGIVMTIGFMIFGVQSAIFWGFITAILSFLPLVGAPIIYIPAAAIMLVRGDYFNSIGLLIWSLLLVSNVDNVLRPWISKAIGNVHPLITLLGVFIGIPIFGIPGIILGPLLISWFFLFVEMYGEEYIEKEKA